MSTLNTNTSNTIISNGGTGSYVTTANTWSAANITVNKEFPSLTVSGSISMNGSDLEERLSNIERILGIPKADPVMFKKYPSLKKKYDEYINELEKRYTWESLKE